MAKVPKEFFYVIMVRHLEDVRYNNETYILGIFSKKMRAMKAAEIEEEQRGGKYRAMWFQAPLNVSVTQMNRKYLLPKRRKYTCCKCKKTNSTVMLRLNPYSVAIHGGYTTDYYCEDCIAILAENI